MKRIFANNNRAIEPIWHVQSAIVVAVVLQLFLPDRYFFGSRLVLVSAELLLVLALTFTTPKEPIFKSLSRRINVLLLIATISLANSYSLVEIANRLLNTNGDTGRELIMAAVNIYLTNIIVFGLLYWEMDAGGPGQRLKAEKHEHDFLYPQDVNQAYRHPTWRPTFIDYVYVSATNGMAFSPTDTMPLTRRAKLLMLVQATISLVTVALVAARAVNIL